MCALGSGPTAHGKFPLPQCDCEQGSEKELRHLLESGSFGSCLPVHLRGAGKVAEIRATNIMGP
jgi:hypothetical protein